MFSPNINTLLHTYTTQLKVSVTKSWCGMCFLTWMNQSNHPKRTRTVILSTQIIIDDLFSDGKYLVRDDTINRAEAAI